MCTRERKRQRESDREGESTREGVRASIHQTKGMFSPKRMFSPTCFMINHQFPNFNGYWSLLWIIHEPKTFCRGYFQMHYLGWMSWILVFWFKFLLHLFPRVSSILSQHWLRHWLCKYTAGHGWGIFHFWGRHQVLFCGGIFVWVQWIVKCVCMGGYRGGGGLV